MAFHNEPALQEDWPAVRKAQWLRVVDVFLFAPAMIWFASLNRPLTKNEKILVLFFAMNTIIFNSVNYLKNQETMKRLGVL